jgi:hypothetical protein
MADDTTRATRDPERAKQLRLTHDRVNTYGQNDKASRKAIPRFKADTNRAHRRGVNALLMDVTADGDLTDASDRVVSEATFKGLHPHKRKAADVPVSMAIGRKTGAKPPLAVRDRIGHSGSGALALAEFRALRGEKD